VWQCWLLAYRRKKMRSGHAERSRIVGSNIVEQEFWPQKGDVKLFAFRKFKDKPDNKPVLVLVHGSSLCALPSYDLRVPGRGSQYSMMDICAERGFDVWTLDHEGYGKSSKTDSNSNIAMAVKDFEALLPILRKESKTKTYNFYGQSSGALRAASFAQAHPELVERLVLDAFVWTGEGSPTLIKRREGLADYRASNRRKLERKNLVGIFSRDMAGTAEDAVAEAVADAQLSYGDSVPSGTFVDMCTILPVVDPEKLACPVLTLRGAHDGIATLDDLLKFFAKLPNDDKQFTVMAGAAHITHLGLNKDRFYNTLFPFLETPARKDGVRH
jgi:pimeloyl-ACP methyl ester carboxylesterase